MLGINREKKNLERAQPRMPTYMLNYSRPIIETTFGAHQATSITRTSPASDEKADRPLAHHIDWPLCVRQPPNSFQMVLLALKMQAVAHFARKLSRSN
jgi:hypothetical protein